MVVRSIPLRQDKRSAKISIWREGVIRHNAFWVTRQESEGELGEDRLRERGTEVGIKERLRDK